MANIAFALTTLQAIKSIFKRTKIVQAPTSRPMKVKKYSTIIFDLSGVLQDEKQAPAITMRLWPNNLEALRALKTLLRDPLLWELFRGTIDVHFYAEAMQRRYGFDANLITEAITTIPTQLPLLPWGLKILQTAKAEGYKVYLLTNIYPSAMQTFLAKHDFFSLFDGMMASCDVGLVKPEPEIYQTLMQRFNINPNEALFIDDRAENIAGAAKLGIDGIICRDTKKVFQLLVKNNVLSSPAPTQAQ